MGLGLGCLLGCLFVDIHVAGVVFGFGAGFVYGLFGLGYFVLFGFEFCGWVLICWWVFGW